MRFLFIIFVLIFSGSVFAEQFGMGCLRVDQQRLLRIPKAEKPLYGALNLTASIEVDLSANLPPVKSQGSQGSCVGWATGYYMKTFQEKKEHGGNWDASQLTGQCSPAFVYNHINGGKDNGSFIDDALQLLCDMGAPSWEDMPYDSSNFTAWPVADVYKKAMPQRALSYEMIYYGSADDTDLALMRDTLSQGNCLVISTAIYDNFDNWVNKTDDDVYSATSGSLRGYHAMCVVGYSSAKQAFKIVNSWGTYWGANGFIWMHENLMKSGIIDSAYRMTDRTGYAPNFTVEASFKHTKRSKITMVVGQGDTANPVWSLTRLDKKGGLFTMNSIAFDVSEKTYDQSKDLWLKITDASSGVTGTLSVLKAVTSSGMKEAADLPKSVGSGKTVYVLMTTPGAKTQEDRLAIDKSIKKDSLSGDFTNTKTMVDSYFGK